ncbi:diagnostic antigen [Trypanosoma theileri]|uniref:Diagnostic antigen n=1 Tax=Trypanosoma theileri TaxID=67003 RepID=A0A1X0P4A0_9TRYP|nr:diagnostic antigen [Trypanosoma theileri]ORC91661.1 diagnostic antigen [Trypanosoma theileri]
MSSKICHVVMFSLNPAKLKAVLPSDDDIERHLQNIRKLVPGVLDVQMGPAGTALYEGYVNCNGDYTHCLVSRHVDVEALRVYATHPTHLELAQKLASAFEKPPVRIDFALKE